MARKEIRVHIETVRGHEVELLVGESSNVLRIRRRSTYTWNVVNLGAEDMRELGQALLREAENTTEN